MAKLTAADGAAHDLFGISVSVAGDTAIVGADQDVGDHTDQGAAYVFYRNQSGPGAWGQVAKLIAADGAAWNYFGRSVSVSGDTAVVAANWALVGGNGEQGAAYVFRRNHGGLDAWGQMAKLVAADGAAGDHFGSSVSIDGDTAVVGASDIDVGSNGDQGAAYVFYRNQGGPDAWSQVAKLIAADGAASNHFGSSVSVSGDTAVVAAWGAEVSGTTHGAAYVFRRNQGGVDAWGQVAKLIAADGAANDFFGVSVSVNGDTAVVGASNVNVGGNLNQGAAYVFYRNQGGPDAWSQVAKLIAADGKADDCFGTSVSISGDTAVVGASAADNPCYNGGAAYVFDRDQGGTDVWGLLAKLTVPEHIGDYFGRSVSVDGSKAVIGASYADVGNNDDQGAAYVYALLRRRVFLPLVVRGF